MKKILSIAFAVFYAIILNAQISVWDGTAEPWTHGSGTEDDPYLIENAQQLAYLAVQTNELHYSNYEYHNMYVDTCFLLTVDLDLGGENGLIWEPIAKDGFHLQTRSFSGHFDGGNHVISNLQLQDGNGIIIMGLFGHIKDGSIKNIIIDGKDLTLPSFHLISMPTCLGIIIGYGENVVVDNCRNNIDFTLEHLDIEYNVSVGGLFGWLLNSTITNCRNYGNINVSKVEIYHDLSCGGICGNMCECYINTCSNHGNLFLHNDFFAIEKALCGGIAGRMSGTMTDCYNTGRIDMVNEFTTLDLTIAMGGLVGGSMEDNNLFVTNSYSVSEMTLNGKKPGLYIGGIVAYKTESALVTTTNCYYLNIIQSNDYGIPKSASEMKTQEFVNLLNTEGEVFAMDNMNVNQGYPIFAQYAFVDENSFAYELLVYPNPINNVLNIIGADYDQCQSIAIYSIDGRHVETFLEMSLPTTINIANLTTGIYMIRVKMTDGRMFAERIVKK